MLDNLPDELYQVLRQRAQVRHTSVNDEIVACLRAVVRQDDRPSTDEILHQARTLRSAVKGFLSEVDLAAMKAQGRP